MLFELIAERYERRSILITANQPFSGWDHLNGIHSVGWGSRCSRRRDRALD